MSLRLAQGALFIVDNAGTCPPSMTTREFQDMVIENHLKDHTYYSGNTRERVDSQKMRKRIGDFAHTRLTGIKFEPESGENKTDAVFRLGSDPLPPELLSRYNYDKATFSEADLPAYIPLNSQSEEKTENHNLRAHPAEEPMNLSSQSRAGKRKHSEAADAGGEIEQTPASIFDGTNRAKRQAIVISEDSSSYGGESQFTVRNAQDENTSKTLLQSSEMPRPHESPMIQHDRLPLAVSETVEPASLDAIPRSIPESQQDPQQWSHIDIKAVRRQLSILQSDVREAVRALLASIGRIDDLHCPLDPNPSKDLEDLFMRSLGPEWRRVSDRSISFNDFRPELVIMSLISAYLHDNVVSQQVPAQKIAHSVTELLQASGPLGEQYLQHMDLQRTSKYSCQEISVCTLLTICSICGRQGFP
jgi:hypothetical protein